MMAEDRVETEWDKRSQLWGASLRSVLFKGLPDALNLHIHRWHLQFISRQLPLVPNARILDIGCGYGRLTEELLARCPELEITGVDITQRYVDLYRQRTGRPAVRASIEELPEELKDFDGVVCVTVLMYVGEAQRTHAIRSLLDRTTPQGIVILIEPHESCVPWQTLFGLLPWLRRRRGHSDPVDTGGHHFGTKELNAHIRDAGGAILREERAPLTAIAMLPLFAACKVLPGAGARPLLSVVDAIDRLLGWLPLPTLYRALSVRKR